MEEQTFVKSDGRSSDNDSEGSAGDTSGAESPGTRTMSNALIPVPSVLPSSEEEDAGSALVPLGLDTLIPQDPAMSGLVQSQPQGQYLIEGGKFDRPTIGGQTYNVTKNEYQINIMQSTQKEPTVTSPLPQTNVEDAEDDGDNKVDLSSTVTIFEDQPVCYESRIFRGKIRSAVAGDQDVIVKVLPNRPRQQKEAKIHFSVPNHHNIVQRFLTNTFKYRGLSSIYIVMELCDPLNLYQFIQRQNQDKVPFDSNKFTSFAEQIITGLAVLHKYKVIHRDLKPHNLLLAENGTVIKISDFGLSKIISTDQTSTRLSNAEAGTDGWRSPELLRNADKISTTADIFSLGLVLFHVLSYGKHPFGGNPHSWNHYIIHNENLDMGGLMVPNAEVAKEMLMPMLEPNPQMRPKAEEILKHSFFKENAHLDVSDAQLQQLASSTFSKLTAEQPPADARQGASATALPGVQETAEKLSKILSCFIDDNALELKPKLQGEPPVKLTDLQLSQLASETFTNMSLEEKVNIKQNMEAHGSSPGIPETALQLSKSLMNFLRNNDLALKSKSEVGSPEGLAEEKLTQVFERSFSQLPTETRSEAKQSGGIMRSISSLFGRSSSTRDRAREHQGAASSPSTSIAADFYSKTLEKFLKENNLEIRRLPTDRYAICCFSMASKTLQVHEPSEKSWTKQQELHKDMIKWAFTAVVLDNKIYALLSNSMVYRLNYTDSASSWSQVSSMNADHALWPPATTVNGAVYVIGSSGPDKGDVVERFDPQDGRWIAMGKMNQKKRGHAVAATKGFIYCFGGWDGNASLRSVERFDPLNNGWADVAPMQHARQNAAATVLDSKIFVLGGYPQSQFHCVEFYDQDTDSWTSVANMKIARRVFSAVVINGRIFAVGGVAGGLYDAKTIEMFDPQTNQWEIVADKLDDMKLFSPAAVVIRL